MTFKDILSKYRNVSFSERDKGNRFERLMQRFLQSDATYKDEFEKVWLWDEFPFKSDLGGKDLGIDLVAKHKHGQYWAIQCKFYAESTTVDKKSVDSFISTANRGFQDENGKKHYFDFLLWISTSDKWGVNAQETLLNQKTKVGLLLPNALEESNVDWQKLEDGIHGVAAQKSKKSPREHQINAINNTNIHFQNNERGKLIMACGTGKTYTALQIAENETNHKGTILFLVPSIALLGQTLREWKSDAKNELN
jgi:predicted helicase